MEERIVPEHGLALETVALGGIQPEVWKNWRLPYQIPAAVARAAGIIGRFDPDLVFGTGGYVVGAVGAAAVIRRKPLYLQVPDAYPGRTIRALARRARTVFAAFDSTAAFLPGAHVEVTGTPLREELWEPPERPRQQLRTVLVFGGSQGARRLNLAVEEALRSLMEIPGLRLHHICGAVAFEQLGRFRNALPEPVRARYTLEAFSAEMAGLLAEADLVVARAGGSAVAEMTAVGVPMILVPYPFAGGHQRFNAEPAVSAGAAVLVPDAELSGVRLATEVQRLAAHPDRLASMAAASRGLGCPGAARAVARALLEAAA
jgi:UDP-N-acetylglucosamine--N-acetylmuramyl-(pentapeptide) pyrophosphoryl-undecaprenol N-acetylglucosamine transferase